MRVFYAVPEIATPAPRSALWHANLYMSLRDLGHDVVCFDFDYSGISRNLDLSCPEQADYVRRHRPFLSEELLRQVRRAQAIKPIDLFFSYFYSAHVEPDAIREIGRMGIMTVNWYCNASYQFHLVQDIAPAYHYSLVPEKFRLEDYRRIGATPIYCQEAANPNAYKPYDLPVEYAVTFVGQKYGDRPYHIRRLIDAGIDTRVWGPHWVELETSHWRKIGRRVRHALFPRDWRWTEIPAANCGPPLSDEEYIKMYSRSRISLGFANVAEIPDVGEPIKQVRLRDFEAPMSGAFYMAQCFDELTEFFEPGREIVCFSDADELIDKSRYYLAHDAERQRIQQAGFRRARAEHTWRRRFEMVFRAIGLN